ncbi:SCO2400 family protein [Streptomyces sp. NPDC001156]
MTSSGPVTTAHRDPAASVRWHDSLLEGEAESNTAMDVAPHVAADAEGLPPARPGRAARRRRLARWRKNKRRAAVASAVALVGGGLSIAMMDRHSTDQAQAAVAPDDPRTSTVQE